MRIAFLVYNTLGIFLSAFSLSSSSAAEVQALFCARENPLVVFAEYGPSATVLGQTLKYSFTVKNSDYAGCLPSTYSLSVASAAGLTPKLSVTRITLNPGSSATITMQVASIPLVDGKSYSMLLTTKNVNAPESATMTQLYYRVALPTPCVRTAPSASFSRPNQTATSAGQALDYVIAVKNNDLTTCGISVYTVVPTLAAGLTSTMPFNKLILNPGQTSTALIKVTASAGMPNQSYSVVGTATNNFVATQKAVATGSYILNTGSLNFDSEANLDQEAVDPAFIQLFSDFAPTVQ